MSNPKKGLRWKIFKLFGPTEVQNLVRYIDELTAAAGDSDIVIYPLGQYAFNVKTSNNQDLEPLIFPTEAERQAFGFGLQYGVKIMGGNTNQLTQEDFEKLEDFEKKSTHGGNGGFHN